jgi:hypothetical protein
MQIEFTNLLIVVAIAVAAPLVPGLAPGLGHRSPISPLTTP